MRAEVAQGSGFRAVQAVAEVHLVQVCLEDLVLRILRFEQCREHDLLELAGVGLVGIEEAQPRELLRDGACTLRPAAFTEVGQRRAGHTHDVYSAMLVEALILNREHRVTQVRRDLIEWDLEALFF